MKIPKITASGYVIIVLVVCLVTSVIANINFYNGNKSLTVEIQKIHGSVSPIIKIITNFHWVVRTITNSNTVFIYSNKGGFTYEENGKKITPNEMANELNQWHTNDMATNMSQANVLDLGLVSRTWEIKLDAPADPYMMFGAQYGFLSQTIAVDCDFHILNWPLYAGPYVSYCNQYKNADIGINAQWMVRK